MFLEECDAAAQCGFRKNFNIHCVVENFLVGPEGLIIGIGIVDNILHLQPGVDDADVGHADFPILGGATAGISFRGFVEYREGVPMPGFQ